MTVFSLKKIFVIFSVLLLLKTAAISAERCRTPSGGVYLVDNDPQYNWIEALLACKRSKAELLTIESKEEMDEIVDMLKREFVSTSILWLGGSDELATEVNFQRPWFSPRGKRLTYFNWGYSDPNNAYNNENCMAMTASQNGFYWSDHACTTKSGYICQLKRGNTTRLKKKTLDKECKIIAFLQELLDWF